MKRQAFTMGTLVALLVSGFLAADETEEKSLAALMKQGAKIGRDEKQPGQPVVFISLSGSKMTDIRLKDLAAFGMLQQLYLGNTLITDAGLKELAPLQQLQNLGLNYTQVTDAGLKELAALKQLKNLWLEGSQVTDAGVQELKKALPGCHIVSQPPAPAPKLDTLPAPPDLADPKMDFYHDFRSKDFPELNFRMSGKNAASRVMPEPDGLRITLPDDQADDVGVATKFNIKGDFEVTVGYEILQALPPKAGWGAGLEVYLMTETPTKDAIGFYRSIRTTTGRELYSGKHMTTDQKGKRQYNVGREIPAAGTSGQLRITRIGPTATLAVAEPSSQGFHVLYSFPLGTEDVRLLRLDANPGGSANPVDLRLIDLRVRAEGLPNLVDKSKAPPRRALWVLAVLVAVTLVIGGLLIWWRKRRAGLVEKQPISGTDKHG